MKGKESASLKEIDSPKGRRIIEIENLKGTTITQSSNGWPHIPLLPESLKPNEDITNRINSSRVSLEKSETITESIPESNAWKSTQRMEMTLSTILATVQQQEAQIRVSGFYKINFCLSVIFFFYNSLGT